MLPVIQVRRDCISLCRQFIRTRQWLYAVLRDVYLFFDSLFLLYSVDESKILWYCIHTHTSFICCTSTTEDVRDCRQLCSCVMIAGFYMFGTAREGCGRVVGSDERSVESSHLINKFRIGAFSRRMPMEIPNRRYDIDLFLVQVTQSRI